MDYDCAYDRISIANDRSPETYTVKFLVTDGETPRKNAALHLLIDGTGAQDGAGGEAFAGYPILTDGEGYFTVTLSKGAHYLQLGEGGNFVYVNNYSGTGTVNTKDGYYTFVFSIPADAADRRE